MKSRYQKRTFIAKHIKHLLVISDALYEEIKEKIPDNIGVHNGDCVLKRARRVEKQASSDVLKDSLIRSLARDADKLIKSRDITLLERYKRQAENAERDKRSESRRRFEIENAVRERFERQALREILQDKDY